MVNSIREPKWVTLQSLRYKVFKFLSFESGERSLIWFLDRYNSEILVRLDIGVISSILLFVRLRIWISFNFLIGEISVILLLYKTNRVRLIRLDKELTDFIWLSPRCSSFRESKFFK